MTTVSVKRHLTLRRARPCSAATCPHSVMIDCSGSQHAAVETAVVSLGKRRDYENKSR